MATPSVTEKPSSPYVNPEILKDDLAFLKKELNRLDWVALDLWDELLNVRWLRTDDQRQSIFLAINAQKTWDGNRRWIRKTELFAAFDKAIKEMTTQKRLAK